MDISSTSNSSFSRPITPSKSSHDRQSRDEPQNSVFEAKAKERASEQRAIQEKLQDNQEESQRRLDGRLISFGSEEKVASPQQQHSFNRTRVNEAYNNVESKQASDKQNNEQSNTDKADAIDIVV